MGGIFMTMGGAFMGQMDGAVIVFRRYSKILVLKGVPFPILA